MAAPLVKRAPPPFRFSFRRPIADRTFRMSHTFRRTIRVTVAPLVLALIAGTGTLGCMQSISSDWAQTAPRIDPLERSKRGSDRPQALRPPMERDEAFGVIARSEESFTSNEQAGR